MTAHRALCLVFLSACLGAAPRIGLASGPARPLTICELFKNLRRYNGRVITISGPMIKHLGRVIGQLDCPHPFVTNGYTWPSMIMLDTTVASEIYGAPAAFSTDQDSMHALDLAILAATKGATVWVTVTGELRLKKHYHSVHTNYGILGDGYGHLGASPALLLIRKVDNVETRGSPNPPTAPSLLQPADR
jgi:hypothetical protein